MLPALAAPQRECCLFQHTPSAVWQHLRVPVNVALPSSSGTAFAV
jgi:hypothetical protein